MMYICRKCNTAVEAVILRKEDKLILLTAASLLITYIALYAYVYLFLR